MKTTNTDGKRFYHKPLNTAVALPIPAQDLCLIKTGRLQHAIYHHPTRTYLVYGSKAALTRRMAQLIGGAL